MIPPNAAPLAHVPPLPRIDLYGPRPQDAPGMGATALDDHDLRMAEAERIWKITRQLAEGTNAPTVAPFTDADTAPSEIVDGEDRESGPRHSARARMNERQAH